jgi:tetraacyldisaccharide 4'-kinase
MTPLEFLYFLGYSLKKRHVLKNRRCLPYPVISIGNLTTGGTGKTPAVIAVAEEAARRGYCPIILTRGYKGRAKGPCLVSAGSGRLLSVSDAGDEAALMAERMPGVAIVKSADRYAGGMFAIDKIEMGGRPPLFILDDGFQHWRLARDIDIALVDGINPFGNRKLIPLGILRGPLGELKDADIIVVTKTRNEALASELKAINPGAPLYFSEYRTAGLRSSEGRHEDLSYMEGKKVFAFCGIANPESFRNTLQQSGAVILGLKSFRDHHAYSQQDMDVIIDEADRIRAEALVTTGKDMVKIRALSLLPSNLYVLEIGVSIDAAFYDDIFGRLK